MNDKHSGPDPYRDLSGRTTAGGRSKGPIVIGVVALVVVVLAVVAVLLSGGGDDDGSAAGAGTGAAAARDAQQETATVTISGEDLPEYPSDAATQLADPATDPAVGQRIPGLSGQSFDGSDVTVDPADGRPKVIVFLAHWCPHCQAEVPRIQQWIEEGNQPDGVDIYAVSTGVRQDQPNYPPSAWMAREGWTPPVLLDDDTGTAATSFGLTGFPYFVLVDGEGNVVQRGSGELPVEDFDAAVQGLVTA
jgi:thiol-disulfide isomerase/thioredoxin